jgi:ATP-dependent HslUV protease subunit HslV
VAAQAAAEALLGHTRLDARAVVVAAMEIAAGICVFTNANVSIEEM